MLMLRLDHSQSEGMTACRSNKKVHSSTEYPCAGHPGRQFQKLTFSLDLESQDCPRGLELAAACPRVDSQVLATILGRFHAIFAHCAAATIRRHFFERGLTWWFTSALAEINILNVSPMELSFPDTHGRFAL